MSVYGSVVFGIKADMLDFSDITKKIGINPTTIYKKGETYNIISRPSELDSWIYEIEFNDNEDPNLIVQKMLTHMRTSKENIREISKKSNVAIVCNITSSSDQIYISFSADTIKKVSEFNVSLEMSILSF